MLIDDDSVVVGDLLMNMLASVFNEGKNKQLATGIYQINHYGSSAFMLGYDQYAKDLVDGEEYFGSYGVCDSVEQLLEKCPKLVADPKRMFVVTLKEVRKEDQESEGGWRWHKWGEYIGTHDIQCEYLYNEKVIESVFVYHIYEKV